MRISASRLKTYTSCGKKYHYKYVENVPEDKSIALVLGSSAHEAIEAYHGVGDGTSVYTETWMALIKEHELENNHKQFMRGMKMLNAYTEVNHEVPLHVELEFEVPYSDEHTLYGFFDQIYPWGFRDLKTNSRKPDQLIINNDIQFVIYEYVYEQLFHKKPERIEWYHLETNEIFIVTPTDEARKSVFETIEDFLVQPTYTKRIDMQCGWCSFKERCLK